MNPLTNQDEEPNWEEILVILLAYAKKQIKLYTWAIGRQNKLQEAEDFVLEAIQKYLENPEDYDSNRSNSENSFVNYLKFNILRRLISNNANAPRNGKRLSNEETDAIFLTMIAEGKNLINSIDIEQIVREVRAKISNDGILNDIFEGLYDSGYKRQDLCEVLELEPREYDNNIRRLRRIVESILKQNNHERKKQQKTS